MVQRPGGAIQVCFEYGGHSSLVVAAFGLVFT